ncbi:cation-translocating P-type ATPase [uncultured Mesonia sp.]|uniref:cation-translocating P-type ATPase n=1 Tax=uncultured Mesonia sp. TaxID=399731 RepID=UPI00374FD2F4
MLFYQEEINAVLEKFKVDKKQGLSKAEVESRIKTHGYNKWRSYKSKSLLSLFIAQLQDALIYVLLVAIAITAYMGEYIDAIIISGVILINAGLGVYQEVKAGKAIQALQKLAALKATVIREGIRQVVDTATLVPGDIVVLETGQIIPADIRLISSVNLQVEEAALTGESVPVYKNAKTVLSDNHVVLGEQKNMVFMSTLINYGRGLGVVVATGRKTEVGKIAENINTTETKTPLEIRLSDLGKTLGKIALGVCFLFFIIGFWQGRPLADLFLTAVSLAVASIPEGLAAIVAIVLSIGVTKMSKKNAIIKRLPAVETLGSVNIICSDKTGTLTMNQMKVMQAYTFNSGFVSRINTSAKADLLQLSKIMQLCNDATLTKHQQTGDPTEIALLDFADQLNINREQINLNYQRIDEYPFDSDRKMMSVIVTNQANTELLVKGAIDQILPSCSHIQIGTEVKELTETEKQEILKSSEQMSAKALRTLAAAYKPYPKKTEKENWEKELIFVGFVGMIDPPRKEAKKAIAKAHQAGIATFMITGDHKQTAIAIAKDLGVLQSDDQAITGREWDSLSSKEQQEKINSMRVFARVSPQHKVNIVKRLQETGHIVSMTGDGVNDAPSLSHANIGVAMGITGTDVAKNASDIILTDDNFATIVSAVEQGRNIYSNIKKSVLFLLTSNLGEVIAMLVSILLGMPVPLIATQLLWINLLTDSLPAIALGMDPDDPSVMQHKPRPPKESFFAHKQGLRVLAGGCLIALVTLSAYTYAYSIKGYSPFDSNIPQTIIDYARSMAFMSIITAQLFYALAFRHYRRSILSLGLFSNKVLSTAIVLGVALQLVLLEIPFLREAFKLSSLSLNDWGIVLTLGLIPLLANEIVKFIYRIKKDK